MFDQVGEQLRPNVVNLASAGVGFS
jgi:hypothetical protein